MYVVESHRSRLLIFAKYPQPGNVKTRLVPPFTFEEAAALYRAFLLDAVGILRALDPMIEPVLYITDAEEIGSMRELISECGEDPVQIRVQQGAELGDRLLNAFSDAFEDGRTRVCAIGTDHPTLPTDYINEGFHALCQHDLTIGPADDGGYYLIGMRSMRPEIFQGMPYSQPGLYERTMRKGAELDLDVYTLPLWYDVDDLQSLRRLYAERGKLPEGSRTETLLRSMEGRIMELFEAAERGERNG